jgi:hypothetical protein
MNFLSRALFYNSPVVREFFSSGRTKSRNRTYLKKQKKEKKRRKRKGEKKEVFFFRIIKATLIRSILTTFTGLPMDRDLRHFWCVIPMADIELLPARTHQRSNVR